MAQNFQPLKMIKQVFLTLLVTVTVLSAMLLPYSGTGLSQKIDGPGVENIYHPVHLVARISATPYRQWTVALLKNYDTLCCGGVLVTRCHVLTAAHCIEDCTSNNAPITVRLNMASTANGKDVRLKDYTVAKNISHEDFDRKCTSQHDIAVLVLENKVPDSIPLAPLSPAGPLYVSQNATATCFAGSKTLTLEEISVLVWDNANCSKVFNESKQKNMDIFGTFLCASSLPVKKFVKNGLSGGPMQIHTHSSGWEVIGIFSWKMHESIKGQYPHVYTRVNRYIDWINNTIHSTTWEFLPSSNIQSTSTISYPSSSIQSTTDISASPPSIQYTTDISPSTSSTQSTTDVSSFSSSFHVLPSLFICIFIVFCFINA